MFGNTPATATQEIAFLLLPDFSMMAFTSSVEPLRAANRQSGKSLYSWSSYSVDGRDVRASNDTVIRPTASIDELAQADVVFVCAGPGADRFEHAPSVDRLNKLASGGAAIGALCSGTFMLARAGLLAGYRCTIHWEYIETFVREFPDLDVTATLFEVDRDRYTCSGGTAPLDMMINSISGDHGRELAVRVATQMLHTFVRHPHDAQQIPLQYRLGISHPKLLAAIAGMEAHLENPVPLATLAGSVELSTRQLERLFRSHIGKRPSQYYLELRLQRARLLLRQTGMPVLQVAAATGFAAASHFSRRYRELFHVSPREERNAAVHAQDMSTAGAATIED